MPIPSAPFLRPGPPIGGTVHEFYQSNIETLIGTMKELDGMTRRVTELEAGLNNLAADLDPSAAVLDERFRAEEQVIALRRAAMLQGSFIDAQQPSATERVIATVRPLFPEILPLVMRARQYLGKDQTNFESATSEELVGSLELITYNVITGGMLRISQGAEYVCEARPLVDRDNGYVQAFTVSFSKG